MAAIFVVARGTAYESAEVLVTAGHAGFIVECDTDEELLRRLH